MVPVKQEIISREIGASGAAVRTICNEALLAGIIIVGSGEGYYVARTKEDKLLQLQQLTSRKNALELRIKLTEAIEVEEEVAGLKVSELRTAPGHDPHRHSPNFVPLEPPLDLPDTLESYINMGISYSD
jgi:hypothetical protein